MHHRERLRFRTSFRTSRQRADWVHAQVIDKSGRGGGIRTRDPLRPRQVRYQAALRPDVVVNNSLRLAREARRTIDLWVLPSLMSVCLS